MASDEIKRRIIESTKHLLQQNASITIKDIAEASYVNIAAVNYHFGSKENLMRIVVEEVIEELKNYVTENVILSKAEESFESTIEQMIHYLYNFSIENIGLLNYLFLSNEIQKESSNLLIEKFFTENEFTRLVYDSLAKNTKSENSKELYSKYIVLFSSFCIPLFVQISQMKVSNSIKIEMFTDPEFRQYFTRNLIKLIS